MEAPEDLLKLSDPTSFLSGHADKLVILDEIQRSPELFLVLRGLIDKSREQGRIASQFLLLGSASIMPGKVNPVVPEMVNQVAYQVMGNDLTVMLACEGGQLQLNSFEPVMVANLLQSIDIMKRAMRILSDRCIAGITANIGSESRVSRIYRGIVLSNFKLMPQTKEIQQQKSSKDS